MNRDRSIVRHSPRPPATPRIGLLEWFRPGDVAHVLAVLDDCARLGVTELRTGVSWAEWVRPGGEKWFDWLLSTLAAKVNVLPCFTYTPPSYGLEPSSASPPRRSRDYADFLDVIVTRHGEHFEWVELWNEPNNLNDWDWRLDPMWRRFCEMAGAAAYWMRRRGKKTVLGGMCPIDPNWLRLIGDGGVLRYIDAVGIHGFPGTWDPEPFDWAEQIGHVRAVLERAGSNAELWISETGFSTWGHDEAEQARAFLTVLEAPVERVYWYGARDLDPERPTQEGLHLDERHYHLGLKRWDGTPKLLARLWERGGLDAVRGVTALASRKRSAARRRPHVLITGGAGFVGTHLADRLLSEGTPVLIYDSLARPGVEQNLSWLCDQHGSLVDVALSDVRNPRALRSAVADASSVFHFAAQVAVTASLVDPIHDFEVNARGALNLLEALRERGAAVPVIFTSTNKVYGALDELELIETPSRYEPASPELRGSGIDERCPLDLHSPYGCSKGAADQYLIDHARTFGIPAAVFRMSCIYGPHQHGTEDQGWVAHFLIRALEGEPITIYGDGKQVRDVLFVEDLVEAMLRTRARIDRLAGEAFNVGGGPANSISLLELLELIGELVGRRPRVRLEAWRVADQRYYVSDPRKLARATGWRPTVPVREGVARLLRWLLEARGAELTRRAGIEAAP